MRRAVRKAAVAGRFNRMSVSSAPFMAMRQMQRRYCTTINCPAIAESISEGTMGQWEVKVGDSVLEDSVLANIESDKVQAPIRAPHDGIITEILLEEGETVQVGQPVLKIKEAEVSAEEPEPEAAASTDAKAAPAETKKETPKPATPPTPKPKEQIVLSSGADREKRVRLTPMRKRIADRLKASQNTAAMLTTFQEIDMSAIISLRNQYKEEFLEKHGVKLGFMSAFVKASASALQAVPIVNAYFSLDDNSLIYHDYVDISVAVATPTGLVVPVLRDCQDMNFADVEKQIGTFAAKARDGTLSLAEMTGGTFTISNGGTYGSWMGTPIINPPQSAVLGMHAVRQKAVVDQVCFVVHSFLSIFFF